MLDQSVDRVVGQAKGTDSPLFFSLRTKFNTAFLNEDIAAAEECCAQAQALTGLTSTEQDILAAFAETGVQEFATPYGLLQNKQDQGGTHLVLVLS